MRINVLEVIFGIFLVAAVSYFLINFSVDAQSFTEWGNCEYILWIIITVILFFAIFRYNKVK